jgi:peptide/nickel transport system substrate-binding protein
MASEAGLWDGFEMNRSRRLALALVSIWVAMLVGCAPGAPGPAGSDVAQSRVAARAKILTIGVTTQIQVMGVFAGGSTGGWTTLNEVHSNGLVTSDFGAPRPIGRLAERVPSLDDGSIAIQPDAKMRVTYHLRRNVTWQDGAPFTAQDLVFTHAFLTDPGLPVARSESARVVESVEAVDDWTVVFQFSRPHFLGNQLGPREFWPQPRHLLGEAYERYVATGNADEVVNLPYWTSTYVHLGPFRVVEFDPGGAVTLQANEGYFLGRPKLDTIRVQAFRDENTLFANVLAGSIDMFPDPSIHAELGIQLKEQWEATGKGTVHTLLGTTSFLSPQWRSAVQREPANHDVRVRRALYQAVDRDSLPEIVQPAWSLLPPGDLFYEATRDAFRRYPYDPNRARATLQDLGWTPGSDGILRNNADGRRFENRISTVATGRLWEVATFADAWRRIGVEVEEAQVPPARSRDLEYRALFPSWEASSSGQGDAILARLAGPAASAQNRWSGNRAGYEDPGAQQLLAKYYTSLAEPEQVRAMHDLSEFVAEELPLLVFYYSTHHTGVRKGVRALDDVAGGQQSSRPYGTYSRNAHLWDIDERT